ncbi:hypothetical protein ABIF64_002891 [Bradyrhizobium japonicum]|nr:hypothetical protein BKD09_43955 [Bradyrhizobium japonicum]TWH91746.1 hypothetical protein IQ17_07341 [Bradyrhizobium daqingense]
MKLQPAQHALTRPAPSDDVEGVSADARLVAHVPRKATLMPLPAADPLHILRISEAPSRGPGGTLTGRPGQRRLSTPRLSPRNNILCLIGKRPDRLLTINRISSPILWALAGSTDAGKCNTPRHRQWNIAS